MSFPAKKLDIVLPTNGGCSWVLCGSSRSGKSTLMKYLVKEFYTKSATVMFSQNGHTEIYKTLGKDVIVSEKFLPQLITEAHEINTKCDNKIPFLFISDDYVGYDVKNSMEITKLLTIFRNANCSSIFSFQHRTLISPTGRAQVNYIAIFAQQTPKNWKNMIDEFLDCWLPMTMTMPEKIAWCKAATTDHQFLFIDNIKGECYISKLFGKQVC